MLNITLTKRKLGKDQFGLEMITNLKLVVIGSELELGGSTNK